MTVNSSQSADDYVSFAVPEAIQHTLDHARYVQPVERILDGQNLYCAQR